MDWTGVRRAAGLALAVVFLLAAMPASALPVEVPEEGPELSLVERVVGWFAGLLPGEATPDRAWEGLGTGIDPEGTEAEGQEDDPTADPQIDMGIDPDG
ncbi:MAG: hypothetical protein ACLF0P_04305 [Thermoanaerobaculia bacterium]